MGLDLGLGLGVALLLWGEWVKKCKVLGQWYMRQKRGLCHVMSYDVRDYSGQGRLRLRLIVNLVVVGLGGRQGGVVTSCCGFPVVACIRYIS